MPSTARLAALAALSAALYGTARELQFVTLADLNSPLGLVPTWLAFVVALVVGPVLGVLGARELVDGEPTPFTDRTAAVTGGAAFGALFGHVVGGSALRVVLGLDAATAFRAIVGFFPLSLLPTVESTVVVALACLAGTAVPRAVIPDGDRAHGPLVGLALVGGLLAGVALAIIESDPTLGAASSPLWWLLWSVTTVLVPVGVVAVTRWRSSSPAIDWAGVALLVAAGVGGYLLGFGVEVLRSMLERPGAPLAFHLPTLGYLWGELVVGGCVVGLAVLAGLAPTEGGRLPSDTTD